MKCPKCKHDLEVTGQEHLETLSEHIENKEPSLKNLWQCVNKDCQCFRAFGWDDYGDFYSGDYYHKTNEVFPDRDFSAIGSLTRQLDVEVYGKGLPTKKFLHPAFALWFFLPYIEWSAQADFDGNILKKWWNIGLLKWDTHTKSYCLLAQPCWSTWSFLWFKFKRDLDNKRFDQAFKRSRNKAWPYVWFHTFITIFYSSKKPKQKS